MRTQGETASFDAFLDRIVQGLDDDPGFDVEVALQRHPEWAGEVRAHLAALARLGLASPPAPASPLPDGPRAPHAADPDPRRSYFHLQYTPPELSAADAFRSAPGRVLGDFRLVRLLGVGGLGHVWEAEQLSLNRRVALKLLKSGADASPRELERFHLEAEAGARLNHPGIAAVHAFGEANGCPYIAQELVPDAVSFSACLEALRGEPTLPPDYYTRIAALFATLAETLQYAHDAGVVHRDLKPQNILIGANDQAKIVDFGLAKLLDAASLSQTGDFAGTYCYMSPEQAMAKRIGIDHRTDVFSLGASLYEALTLSRPFDGDTSHQVAERILYHDPPEPRALRSRVPIDLSVICMKALEKRREDRYQGMAELAADLQRMLRHEPILARPPGVLRRAQKWVRRHPTASAVMTLALLSAVVFAWLTGRLADQNVVLGRTNADLDTARASLVQRNRDLDAALAATQEQRERAEDNAETAQANAANAERERANVLRLSAFQELEDLLRQADGLWPATPELLPAYDDWLIEAADLLAVLQPSPDGTDPGHRGQLAVLRERALPRTEAERQAQRAAHPRAAELQQLDAQIAQAEAAVAAYRAGLGGAQPSAEDSNKLVAIEARVAAARGARDALDAVVDERQVFSFADAEDTWWHNQLGKLIDELEAFADPQTGLIDGISERYGWGIAKRREFAATIDGRTMTGTEARQRWEEASASIADREQCPAYDGLQLPPQLGLLPIGRDPDSGLWEFWHVQSGDEPVRGADGRLVLSEGMGIVLVLIPGRTFWMGAQQSDPTGHNYEPGATSAEGPAHEVTLSPCLLSKYELTQGQWQRFTGSNPSQYDRDLYSTNWNRAGQGWSALHPVEQVSWDDCVQTLFRMGLALPTEAQWESGCRAGTSTAFWSGDEPQSLQGVANLSDQYGKDNGSEAWADWETWLDDGQTVHAPVGSYRPNALGLHEVHGNVWEWCLDAWDDRFYWRGEVQDPVNDIPDADLRVYRGGGFYSAAKTAKSAFRVSGVPGYRGGSLGLRPAKSITPHP